MIHWPIIDFGPETSGPSALETYMSGHTFGFRVASTGLMEPRVQLVAVAEAPKTKSKNAKKSVMLLHFPVHEINSRIHSRAEVEGFEAKVGQTMLSSTEFAGSERITLYFGIGSSRTLTKSGWRKALIGAFQKAKTLKVETVALRLPHGIFDRGHALRALSPYTVGRTIAEVGSSVLYNMNHRKTEATFKPTPSLTSVIVTGPAGYGFADTRLTARQTQGLEKGLKDGTAIGTAVNLARNLANDPPNVMTPVELGNRARQVAADSNGGIKCKVLGRKECTEIGMNAFIAVAAGWAEEPQFIELSWEPADAIEGITLGGIGKGVCFDTGGINLKPGSSSKGMKYDMCGGADMIAAISAIAALKLPIKVKVYCAATTNRTGSNAYLPDGVYVGLDGKSYEVDNTDAEGRLTLVDAIAYAKKFGGVTHIVDYATLTGAILTALADVAAGTFTNNEEWLKEFMAAADSAGERFWQLPTWAEFAEGNKCDMADQKNTGGSFGAGSITAALFVLSAAGKTPIIHADIAGTAFRGRPFEGEPKGGTGNGVRTFIELCERLVAKAKRAKKSKKAKSAR